MFAQIEQSDLLKMNAELTAKEFQLFVAYQMECYEGGGFCKINLKDLCVKYGFKSYDNLTRINQSLISKSWIETSAEGIKCLGFSTEKNSVETENELRKTQLDNEDTEKNSVNQLRKTQSDEFPTEKNSVGMENELRKTQLPTEKNSGTEIALKDLEFKDFKLSLSLLDADVRPPLREIPANELFGTSSDEPMPEEFSPTKAIAIFREIYPTYQLGGEQLTDFANRLPEVEESIWRQNLLDWKLSGWQANNISGIINRYKSELKNWEKEKEREETKNGSIPTNSYKNGKRKQLDRSGGKSDSEKVRTRLRARKPTEV